MGANPYHCYTDYREDVEEALRALQEREFQAGNYWPTSVDADGPEHDSIEEARRAAGATGTQSILDVRGVKEELVAGYASEIDPDELREVCGTTEPTRAEARELVDHLMRTLGRGEVQYAVVSDDGEPDELLFVGCSWD